MALNTPKRVRTVASFASSPPTSDCGQLLTGDGGNNLLPPVAAVDSSSSPPSSSSILLQPQQQQWHNRQQFINNSGHWIDGSLSPVSSCGSPSDYVAPRHVATGGSLGEGGVFYAQSPPPSMATQQQYSGGGGSGTSQDARENRRGRPRSEALTTLMIEGSTSPSAIKCGFCNRVFPREKSLQAHLRTHTGERPYTCDFPGCNRAFTQSGQLKTHQRLHTGERPFMCSAIACQQRFTHANRHCPDHPYTQLRRSDDFVIKDKACSEQNGEVIKWLEKYRMEKEDRTPTRKTPKRSKQSSIDRANNENLSTTSGILSSSSTAVTAAAAAVPQCSTSQGMNAMMQQQHSNSSCNSDYLYAQNVTDSPSTPISNPYKSRKGLMVELDMNAGLEASPVAPKCKANPKQIQWHHEPLSQEEDSGDECNSTVPAQSTFNPKKKWLRDAWQDDLARPLEPILPPPTIPPVVMRKQQTMQAPDTPPTAPRRYVNPNEMRPTVLMVASRDKTMPLIDSHRIHRSDEQQNIAAPSNRNRKWLGALALMQLATNDEDENVDDNNEGNDDGNEGANKSTDDSDHFTHHYHINHHQHLHYAAVATANSQSYTQL